MNTTAGTTKINEGTEAHGFGVIDAREREVGARIQFCTVIVEEGGERIYWHSAKGEYLPIGTHFGIHAQATRGGMEYGASQNWSYFASEAERHTAVEKYLKSAKARAVKQFAVKA